MGFDNEKQAWVEVEVYEYHAQSLPSFYPQSHDKQKEENSGGSDGIVAFGA
jgi:hypothetical protein